MKLKWKALIAAAALAIPAIGWAASTMGTAQACPIPCHDCPFKKR